MKEIIFKTFLLLLAGCWGGVAVAASNDLHYSFSGETATVMPPVYVNRPYSGDIVIPETITEGGKTYKVTKIADNAFAGQKITSIVVGDNVETIGTSAFYDCTSLTKMTLGNSVKSCGTNAFVGCDALDYFNIKNIELWCGIGFFGEYSNPIRNVGKVYCNGQLLTDLVIPSTVKEIAQNSFRGCTSLRSIYIPESVTTIGKNAFSGCTNVTSIKIMSKQLSIPEETVWYESPYRFSGCSVTSAGPIGSGCDFEYAWDKALPIYIFVGMSQLEDIKFPSTLESIPSYCFDGCALRQVTIPSSVKTIATGAFAGCKNLKSAILLTENATAPEGFPNNTTIYVNDPARYYTENKELLKAFCTFTQSTVEYSGRAPALQVQNNMTGDYPNLYAQAEVGTLQKNAGTYTTDVPVTFTGSENFTVNVPCSYTITKAPLIFTVNDAQREFGDGNPIFTYSVSGFKNGENESVLATKSIGTEATMSSNAGTYAITLSATAKNYDITCHNGTLTINKAPLTVGVNDCQKTYGDSNPSFTYYYEGLKLNEGAPTMVQPFETSTNATKSSAAGKYSITLSGGVSNNYYFAQYNKGYLTINKADLKVKAVDVSRLYYEQNPDFPLTYTGFRNNDNENNLTVIPVGTTPATKASNSGTYTISVSGGQSNNYNISYEQGTLTIKQRMLSAKARSYTRKYNDPNPAFEIDYSGFVAGEDESVILAPLTINCEATRKTDVGTYGIYLSGGEADNYTFNYTPGTLTIQKAEQTLVWDEEFAEAGIGDQIALTAEVNSDEEITYSSDDESIASIYQVGTAYFIDCRKAGVVYIRAQQEGSKNYLPSNRIAKKLVIGDTTTGILENDANSTPAMQYYDLSGRQQNSFGNEINILRTPDGRSIKVLNGGTKFRTTSLPR